MMIVFIMELVSELWFYTPDFLLLYEGFNLLKFRMFHFFERKFFQGKNYF